MGNVLCSNTGQKGIPEEQAANREDDEILELLPKREEIRTAIHVKKKKVAPVAKEHTSSKCNL